MVKNRLFAAASSALTSVFFFGLLGLLILRFAMTENFLVNNFKGWKKNKVFFFSSLSRVKIDGRIGNSKE
jgi:hypothetical protein